MYPVSESVTVKMLPPRVSSSAMYVMGPVIVMVSPCV